MKNNLIILLALLFSNTLFAQNISGVINNYTKVTAINQNILTVTSSAGFNIGDKVMLIKMKGASIDQSNSAAFGDTISMGEAGKYIFSFVQSSSPTSITLYPYCANFSNADNLQLVSVPSFPNPTVTGTLTCAAWDGSKGGVLIFETPGTLTLNADIDVSTKGYLGGNDFGHIFSCGFTDFYSALSTHRDGKKGEGIADYILGKESGRGKLANGGGGSYAGNAGAGGGANAGAGGNGGNQYNGSGCSGTGFAGVGGQAIAHKKSALLMGGGGGGPQNDNNQTVFNGGNGGGIVFINANEIIGNGFGIKSNGGNVPTTNDEGSSAGGAGGSVILNCPNYTTALQIETKGGKGGSNFNTIFTTNCHGTGGGGGGGLTWFSTSNTPANVTVSSGGGQAGLILNPVSSCYNTTYFAQNGGNGDVKYDFTPSINNIPGIYVQAKALLDGPYDASLGLMHDSLRTHNLIPTNEPYSSAPYNKAPVGEANGETVSSAVLAIAGNNAIVDWVMLELRSGSNPATVIANKRALIQRDGDIVSAVDGVSPVYFANTSVGNYYVSIKHRNHLGVMTVNPVQFETCIVPSIDFTVGSVYINNSIVNTPRKLVGSIYTLWAGDNNNNKNVKYNGLSSDKDAVLISLGGPAFINSILSNVYRVEDGNMDGKIKYNNTDNDRIIVLNTVGILTPNTIVNQHTPN